MTERSVPSACSVPLEFENKIVIWGKFNKIYLFFFGGDGAGVEAPDINCSSISAEYQRPSILR